MPLKHFTETVLVIALAAVMIIAGVTISTLPGLPAGVLPWAIVFAFAAAYPLALYPTLKTNRADYEFRALHWFPALITVLWLVLQILAQRWRGSEVPLQWLTLGYGGVPITIFFVLLVLFCLKVIRRRVPRLTFLTLLFVPFVTLSLAAEQFFQWDRNQLTAALWQWTGTGALTGGQIAQQPRSLPRSTDPDEEEWRQKLRDRDASDQAARSSVRAPPPSSPPRLQSSSVPPVMEPNPSHLPTSGPLTEAMVPLFAAAYSAVIHQRAKRRMLL